MYKAVLRPIFFLQDPEKIHDRFVWLGRTAGNFKIMRNILAMLYKYEHPLLVQEIDGVTYQNPVGLAAGFDKDCQLMYALPSMGFGFEEVGSITAEAYKGNPGKRLKRLPADESIIVYYGLKNRGALTLRKKLKGPFEFPVGVSVAKTNKKHDSEEAKLADWMLGLKRMKEYGDYITINLSCPNTYDTNNYCQPNLLAILLKRIKKEKITFNRPVYLKITADLKVPQVDEIISLADDAGFVSGFIVSNLVKDRSTVKLNSPKEMYEPYKGGLSGKVVFPKAVELVKHFYKQGGDRYTIIGCGGIFTAEDAWEYIKNGASLLQLITGMIYEGPGAMKAINSGIVEMLEEQGFEHLSDAVGCAHK